MIPERDVFIHANVHTDAHRWYKNGESIVVKCCKQQLHSGLGGLALISAGIP